MQQTEQNPVVRKVVAVNAEPEHAFAVFTKNMGVNGIFLIRSRAGPIASQRLGRVAEKRTGETNSQDSDMGASLAP
jgi:hypothetical protein